MKEGTIGEARSFRVRVRVLQGYTRLESNIDMADDLVGMMENGSCFHPCK